MKSSPTFGRRDFLKALGLSTLVFEASGCMGEGSALPPSQTIAPNTKARPNIVFILADDMGYGDIRALAPETCKFPTPALDGMVAQGMTFTEAHSGSAVCTPTRYGILTGRYAWRSRLKRGVLLGFDRALIEDGRPTVASMLKAQGYTTACIGKWHLGMDMPTTDGKPANAKNVNWKGRIRRSPIANGFDSYFGISASLDMPPFIWIRDDRFVGTCTTQKRWGRKGPAEASFDAVDVLPRLGAEAEKFILAQKGSRKPFFLYLPLTAPHTPIVPSKAFAGKSGLSDYGDFCMQVDSIVGQVRSALEKAGCAENTLLIFTADNGCSPAANTSRLERKGHFPSAGRRGYKADAYDGGHRVPFLACWPARVAPGSKEDDPICLTDLYATCAEIVGAPIADNAAEDSASILPLLEGKTPSAPTHEAIVHHSIEGAFAIRQGKWKLIVSPGSGGWSAPKTPQAIKQGLPPVQLFDVVADPAEKQNLQAQHPEIVKRLQALLERYKTSGRSVPAQRA